MLEVQVKPRSTSFRIKVNNELVIFCKQPPVEGKVNRELTKELSKIFRKNVEIISGFRSRNKRILVKNAPEKDVLKILESMKMHSGI